MNQLSTNLRQSLGELPEGKVKEFLTLLLDEHDRSKAELLTLIHEKDQQILDLQNEVTNIELRVRQQERYSSKDCLIFTNPPIASPNDDIPSVMCSFLKQFLNWDTNPGNFKACHYLGKWRTDKHPPAVIIKFIYFSEKDAIYGRRTWLSKKMNPFNEKPIFIKERLAKYDLETKLHAESQGLITTTYNAQVKVFVKEGNGNLRSVPVNSVKDVEDIKGQAAKKAIQTSSRPASTPNPRKPVTSAYPSKEKVANILKRVREVDEKEGMSLLESIININSPEQKRFMSSSIEINEIN